MKKSFVCSLIGLCALMLAGCGETTSENKNTVALVHALDLRRSLSQRELKFPLIRLMF